MLDPRLILGIEGIVGDIHILRASSRQALATVFWATQIHIWTEPNA